MLALLSIWKAKAYVEMHAAAGGGLLSTHVHTSYNVNIHIAIFVNYVWLLQLFFDGFVAKRSAGAKAIKGCVRSATRN